jgi:hypothetical protein
LHQAHAEAREAGAPQKEFKKWLSASKKARFNAETIQRAAMDTPTPAELEAFLDLVRRTVDERSTHSGPPWPHGHD